jgi:cytochrome c biogenesis protein CcmG, thiol:disulfide interchange protein DsbE
VVLALNIRQSSQALEEFNQANNFRMTVLMDPGARTALAYNVSGIPVTYFIDRLGIIRTVQYGEFGNAGAVSSRMSKISG